MEDNKYYTPVEDEFCKGFEYEVFEKASDYGHSNYFTFVSVSTEDRWLPFKFPDPYVGWNLSSLLNHHEVRVKYLDRKDIEDCGFTDKNLNAPTKYSFYKLFEDNRVIEVKVYWHMDRNERDNLIRIFKGTLHNYPYTEVFRGEIKNKTEFKKLLKQLGV